MYDLEWVEKDLEIPAADITPEKLTSYGFDSPMGTIEARTVLGTKIFTVGGPNPGGAGVYVREGGDGPVCVVKKALADNLKKTVYEMRTKSVVTMRPGEIRYIKMFGPSKGEIAKEGEYWNIKDPFVDYADPAALAALIDMACKLKVVNFVDDAPQDYSAYGLLDPQAALGAEEGRYIHFSQGGGGGKEVTVYFGGAAPSTDGTELVYAAVKGEQTVFTLPARMAEGLFVSISGLKSANVTRFDPYILTKAAFSYKFDQVEFARRDDGWHMTKPFETVADRDAVVAILNAFNDAKIVEHVESLWQFDPGEEILPRFGLDVPTGSFSFVEGDSLPVSVMIGSRVEGGYYAKRSDTPGIFVVSEELVELLKSPALQFHTRDLQRIPMDRAASMTIARDGMTWKLGPSKASPDWNLIEPVAAPSNPQIVSRILIAFATKPIASTLVEAQPADLSAYGLDVPSIRVSVEVRVGEGEKQPAALLVGKPAKDGECYAMLEGGDLVFTISSDFARALKSEPRDGAVMAFSRQAATAVEFSKGNDAFRFTKNVDGEWIVEAPEGFITHSTVIEDELISISRIEAVRFITYETKDLVQYGLLVPVAVVRVETPSGVAALSVGEMAPSGHYYATSTLVDGVFLVDPGGLINVFNPARLLDLPSDDEASPDPADSEVIEIGS
jgi:hypothetical protein